MRGLALLCSYLPRISDCSCAIPKCVSACRVLPRTRAGMLFAQITSGFSPSAVRIHPRSCRWYSQAGTPDLVVSTSHNPSDKTFTLKAKQVGVSAL